MTDSIEIIDNPSQDDIQFLRDNLIENNRQFVGDQRRCPIAVFYRDQQHGRVGGCSGHTYGNWLYIEYLWVVSNQRGNGLGEQLLRSIEQAASERGCHFVLLDTFSFQARPFYEKRGYSLIMTQEQCPTHHQRYYLTKRI